MQVKMETTPITISSSSNNLLSTPITNESPITIPSSVSSSPRMPVSGCTKRYFGQRTDSNTTINPDQKVANWIIDNQKSHNFRFPQVSRDRTMNLRSFNRNVKTEEDNNSNASIILVRCDFDKSSNQLQSPNLISYLNNSNSTGNLTRPIQNGLINNNNNSTNEKHFMNYFTSSPSCSPILQRKSFELDDKSKCDVPLSPESQKKELCSYLKLMNPADRKVVLSTENRRSIRVKNLNKIQEKRESDKKLSTLKSMSELNITADKYEKFNKCESPHLFIFPFPPKKLLNNVDHFDNAMKVFLKTCKVPKKNKENHGQILTNGQLKKTVNNLSKAPKKHKKIHNSYKIKLRPGRDKKSKKLEPVKRKLRKRKKYATTKHLEALRKTVRLKPGIKSLILANKTRKELQAKKLREARLRLSKKPFQSISLTPDANRELPETSKEVNLTETKVNSRFSTTNVNNETPLCGFDKSVKSEVEQVCKVYKIISKSPIPQEVLKRGEEDQAEDETVDSPVFCCDEDSTQSADPDIIPVKNPMELLSQIEQVLSEAYKEDDKRLSQDQSDKIEGENLRPCLQFPITEHDYANLSGEVDEESDEDELDVPKMQYQEFSTQEVAKNKWEYHPFKQVKVKSLHRSLIHTKRKLGETTSNRLSPQNCDLDSQNKNQSQSHSIYISKDNGSILNIFYVDFNLVICQEFVVSLWMQTALGNILGAQNMWISKGHVQRLALNNNCIQKETREMVISMENVVAYVELWTKEHKSDIREGPVADVFATVYFWKQRQAKPDKKVIQLANIKGFADDVQYVVTKLLPKIVVSWHSVTENSKTTYVHAYQLAEDYQTVANIYEIEPVSHYVSSLHNIEDCDTLLLGCGENKITIWNLEYGNITATIELTNIKSPLSTLWAKSDRGFLFTVQQCVDKELRLIAINGINLSWKKLASYNPPSDFDSLRGVCIENGLVMSFYEQGIVCWNATTGEPVLEESLSDFEYIPAGNYIVMVVDGQIVVRHTLTYFASGD